MEVIHALSMKTFTPAEYQKLGHTFKPDYPKMKRLADAIADARAELRNEVTRVLAALEADYRTAIRTEQEFQKSLDDQRNMVRQLGAQMVQYNLLRREVDTSRDLYAKSEPWVQKYVDMVGLTGAEKKAAEVRGG
jgi:uncharacterized protein involved in exopolysaccharide biosynthesis